MSERDRNLVYELGEWQLHLGRRELLSRGVPVPIGDRAFEIFEMLVRSANDLITKNDLMKRIWPGGEVGENTLQVHISAIRKALGRDRAMPMTTSSRRYRLTGAWTVRRQEAVAVPVGLRQTRASGETVTNFPAAVTQLVGRLDAVRRVQDLVSAYRAVTLTVDPAASGKPRLRWRPVRGLLPGFDDGGWLVELAAVGPRPVPSAGGPARSA